MDEIEQRLDAGEWLRPGEVATLLDVSRTTVHGLLKRGEIRYRATPGGQRRCNPEDVRRLLDAARRVHGGDA